MRNGKYAKRGVATKTMVLVLAVMLIVGATIGGTIAWLQDSTATVTNTFTAGDVDITLTESPLNSDGTYGNPAEGVKNAYQMIPGQKYKKDPKVTVLAVSEKCYLFVKFEENGNAASYIDYTSTLTEANGWALVDGETNVWYIVVEDTDADQSWNLLKDDTITINAENVTKKNMATATAAELVYTAYAVQYDNVTNAAAAWAIVNPAADGE